ncbi:ATP-binding protein [Tateyamaria sp. SN3-11]|uniref:hybrid sensor histidine kinase/response regulator n=1 Tax=Tateyamaria sp. SN3-11 TaxID=3092147 RepID=UPI0039EC7094
MVINLVSQVRGLSRAAEDNMQWSISQIDTEFANLDAALTDQIATQGRSPEQIQLRIDIALSRLNIINSGRAAEIFGESAEAAALIEPINAFAEDAVAILDAPGPLVGAELATMQRLVREVRPFVRDIALLGVRLSGESSEERRAQFASQLSWTGGIAIALLILMAILMLCLDQLLQRAVRRDAALSASSKQLASTVAASLDAIVTADDTGRVTNFNAAAERVFGWSRDEIVGLTMEDTFIPHRMRDAHHNGMRRYLDTGKPRVVDAGRVELAALRKSGEEFPVELNITTAQDGDDVKFIAYIRDISARKINEQKLIDARDRAERTDKAKSQFLTVMSHEMRTPLNGILGVLDLLKTTPMDEQQARYARIATSSSEVLLEHVNEALDITRIETGELQLTFQDFALTDLMQELVDMFDPLAKEKNLSIRLDVEPAMRGPYHGDSGRIRQILTNLIGNAIKFTEDGGITLRVSGIHGPETSSLRFEVRDTGIGIPADQHEQVFEDFFAHARSEGRQARGDGLGLSISRRIARAMEGDVSLKSDEGAGSVFILTVPLRRTEPVRRQDDEQAQTQATRACSILIVEDNSINRSVLSDMLTAMGHNVREAVNGADCLDRVKDEAFDIILMDISMPVMDGIEATHHLRRGGGPNVGTHIVGLTAHGREEYRERAVEAGMDRFHTKPIRLEALHNIIAEVTATHLSKPDATHFPDALVEMIDMLGQAKVATISDRFLSELATFSADLRTGQETPDLTALADAAHKAKGAASLLGQVDLQDALATLEQNAREGTLTKRQTWADTLDARAAASRAVFDKALAPDSDAT